MQTIHEFIEAHGLTMTMQRAVNNPNMDDMPAGSAHWLCTIHNGDKAMEVSFSQGPAITEAPTLADVLDCLASDSGGVENAAGRFEDWAGEYGYDTDSRKAERTFRTCEEQARQLSDMLGSEAYESLLWDTERA